jgi:hypothetical protein
MPAVEFIALVPEPQGILTDDYGRYLFTKIAHWELNTTNCCTVNVLLIGGFMVGHYILKDKTPVEVSLEVWAIWFGTANRTVDKTEVAPGIEVSTVFLGLDHSFGDGPPLLFESMLFDDYDSGHMTDRYSTWEEAEAGHRAMVLAVRKRLGLTETAPSSTR